MNRFLKAGSCWLILLWAFYSPTFGQPAPSLNDRYRQISRLMAQQNYEGAIAESKSLIEESPGYYNAYLVLVRSASEAGQLDQTHAWLESLLARAHPQAYVGLALVREVKSDFAGAIENYLKCLRELPDHDRVAVMLATNYVSAKRVSEAETFFKSLLTTNANSVSAHHGLGVLYAFAGRRQEALAELDRVIALQPENALAHSYRGYVLVREGRHAPGIEALKISLRLLEENPDDFLYLNVLNQLGDLYRRSGDYVQAAKNLESVLVMARASDDLRGEETALSQLASLHYRQNNYPQALEYWRKALSVSQTIRSRKTRIGTFPQRHIGGLGDVYERLGDLEAAEKAYLEALTLSQGVDETNQSSVLQSLGVLYVRQGKVNEALPVFQQSLALGEKLRNWPSQLGALNSLSALYRLMGDAEKAKEYVDRSLKLLQDRPYPLWDGETSNNLGLLHLRFNEPLAAVVAFKQTLTIDANAMSPRIVWQAHSGLADAYFQLNQLDQAREHYQKAIEVMENVRAGLGGESDKAGFFQDKVDVFKKLVAVLLDPRLKSATTDRTAAAFNYAERARARALFDLLAEARIDVEQNLAPDLLKQKNELQQRIAQLTAQLIKERSQEAAKQDKVKIAELDQSLSQADSDLGDWLRELRRRNPRYAALKYPEPVTLAGAQRLLGDDTVLLSYSLAEPASFLFAVSGDDFQVRRLPSEQALRENVEKFLVALTDKNQAAPEEYRRRALYLSQQLLQPVSRMLTGKKSLVIIADGSLHRLPFEALFSPGSPVVKGDFRKLPYLIKRFAISYAPSASVLAELQNEPRETAPKGFIAFGDPVYEQAVEGTIVATLRSARGSARLNLQPLPYSREEVDGIARLFRADEREVFLGEAANEENVKAPQRLSNYRFIHFSTHGYVNEARPRLSGLLLSQPGNPQSEDGLLSSYEIFNLKLKADLVVLSACETGLGKEIKGEGLMSLMRAFMYAGTPSVVVSLWNVNDESAADLMVRFYRHLQKDGVSKSEALRQAQLEMINYSGFPFFWAPFVLVGKP